MPRSRLAPYAALAAPQCAAELGHGLEVVGVPSATSAAALVASPELGQETCRKAETPAGTSNELEAEPISNHGWLS
ncbi:MAG: hypothetical protein RL033_4098 [Pseudomonadota bacterium]